MSFPSLDAIRRGFTSTVHLDCGRMPAPDTAGCQTAVRRPIRGRRMEGIGKLKGVEIVWKPRTNQGLERLLDPQPGANEEDHDRFTDGVIQRVVQGREAFFMGTTWRGRRATPVSVLN